MSFLVGLKFLGTRRHDVVRRGIIVSSTHTLALVATLTNRVGGGTVGEFFSAMVCEYCLDA